MTFKAELGAYITKLGATVAFDCIGGAMTGTLLSALPYGGTLYQYGACAQWPLRCLPPALAGPWPQVRARGGREHVAEADTCARDGTRLPVRTEASDQRSSLGNACRSSACCLGVHDQAARLREVQLLGEMREARGRACSCLCV
jgi:hypothetical protein